MKEKLQALIKSYKTDLADTINELQGNISDAQHYELVVERNLFRCIIADLENLAKEA